MRHGKKFNHLSRKKAHRKAMLSNMASSLIKHKRIITTVAKAKALRQYVEPLITKSKANETHSRRVVFSYLRDKDSIKELFGVIAPKIANRPGGYTRIIKTGTRLGDNAEMCMIELVDFNEIYTQSSGTTTTKKKRSRRGAAKKTAAPKVEETVVEEATEAVEEAKSEEAPADDATDATDENKEEKA